MPNWSTTDVPNTGVSSYSTVVLTPYITIVPNGGYTITPENFIIGGATPTYPSSNTWVGGNVDNIITEVTFTQDGLNVRATATCESALFNADSDLNIDIDENPDNPVTTSVNGFCITLEYPFETNATVTFNSFDNTVETLVVGDASNNHKKKISGYGENLDGHAVASVVILANVAGYTMSTPAISINPGEGCEGAFSIYGDFVGGTTIWQSAIHYTTTAASESNNPCEFNNTALVSVDIVDESVVSTNTVHGLVHHAQLGLLPKTAILEVRGDSGTQYKIFVRRSTDNYYYNWDGTFGASLASSSRTIGSNGVSINKVKIPKASSNVDYVIWLEGLAGATLATGVPDAEADDVKMSQFGVNSATLVPFTEVALNASGGFGTLPASESIKRSIRYVNADYNYSGVDVATFKGKTSGISSKVSLFKKNPSIKPGMYIMGDEIPHDTIVKEVFTDHVIISNSTTGAVSGNLKCVTKTSDVIPFSFTIIPTTAPNVLSVNTSNDHTKSVWGLRNIKAFVDGAQSTATTIVLASTNDIIPGMNVTGDGIAADTTVSSIVHSTNTVTVNNAHSGVSDLAIIDFKGANNPNIFLESIKVLKVGDDIVISGYLKILKLDNASRIEIFLDDIINAT